MQAVMNLVWNKLLPAMKPNRLPENAAERRKLEAKLASLIVKPQAGQANSSLAANISGKWFRVVAYGLDTATELIDYDAAEKLAHQHKPKLIIAGASAYSRLIDWARFRAIADSVGAYLMADIAHYAGLIAAGLYPTPVGVAHFVTSTTHKTLRGPRGGLILAGAEHRSVNSAVFPGLQGGPLMPRSPPRRSRSEALSHDFRSIRSACSRTRVCWRRCCATADCASSPAAPIRTSSWSTCARRKSRARMPRRRSAAPTSRSTRMRFRTIRKSPS
jgi:hypothetical protein